MNPTLRRAGLALLLLSIVLSPALPADARTLRDRLRQSTQTIGVDGGAPLNALAESIANTAARNLPVISASAGYTYRYNPEIEAFELASDTLGPLLLERPDTLGQGKFNLNFSFMYVQFDEFDGDDMSKLEAEDPIALGASAFRVRYRTRVQTFVSAVSATYGLFDDLDLNILVPVLLTGLDIDVRATEVARAGADGVFAPIADGAVATGETGDDKLGVGDIFLRLKYQLPRADDFRSALGLQMRLPSGNKDNFQGVGAFEISPFLYASQTFASRVALYANAGIDVRPEEIDQSQVRYGAGVDVDVTPRIGLSLAFLGRHELSRSAAVGATDLPHLTESNTVEPRPVLGLDLDRKDFYDLMFGVRFVNGGNATFFAYGIYALNDDGWRNETIIPGIGVEITF